MLYKIAPVTLRKSYDMKKSAKLFEHMMCMSSYIGPHEYILSCYGDEWFYIIYEIPYTCLFLPFTTPVTNGFMLWSLDHRSHNFDLKINFEPTLFHTTER